MDLLVFILSLGHSKRIKVEPFTYICFLFRSFKTYRGKKICEGH